MSDDRIACRERADLLMDTGRALVTADSLLGGLRVLETAPASGAFLIECLATCYKLRETLRAMERRLVDGRAAEA